MDLADELKRQNELYMAKLRITELESQLRIEQHANTTLQAEQTRLKAAGAENVALLRRNVELGAENATLRETLSAHWATWADALWHSDDPTRPAQPADCSTREAMQLLLDRYVELMAEGTQECIDITEQGRQALADLRAEHVRAMGEVEQAVLAVEDNVSKLQSRCVL